MSSLAKSTTPLSPVPHVGMYDGPAGRCIVSERIGGTAATFTEGLAPRPSAAEVNPAVFTQTPPPITNVFG